MSALRQWLDRRRPETGSAAYGPSGVFITQEHLQVVQLERLGDGGIGVRACESLAYPGSRAELVEAPVAIRKLIRRAMRDGKFRGRKVVSAMPPEQVRVMSVSYPANAAGSAASSIAKLMADRVDGALTDYVIDYVPITMSSRDGDHLALVAVSRLEHVNNYLDILTSAGLHVDFLEIGPLAIKRLIASGPATDQYDHAIVVNVGPNTSHITTISGERLLADQEIQFGADLILNAIATPLNLTTDVAKDLVLANGLDPVRKNDEDIDSNFDTGVAATLVQIVKPEFLKLVREIDRAFLFADSESHSEGRKKIIIVGGHCAMARSSDSARSLAGMSVERLGLDHMPFARDSADAANISGRQAAEMSTAVGLALRGMSAHE